MRTPCTLPLDPPLLMIPDFFVSHATSKTFKIVFLAVKETFSENPLIGTAAKFQYKFPLLRTLAVMDTIS